MKKEPKMKPWTLKMYPDVIKWLQKEADKRRTTASALARDIFEKERKSNN